MNERLARKGPGGGALARGAAAAGSLVLLPGGTDLHAWERSTRR
jgi:hypothetical protein